METIIVTRHEALVAYLMEEGIAPSGAEVIAQAATGDVAGKHVIGVMPLHLAAAAGKVTVVPLVTPPELRGVELTVEQVREFAGHAATYIVKEV